MNRDVKVGLVLGFMCLGVFLAVFFIRGAPQRTHSPGPLGDEGFAELVTEEAMPILIEELNPVRPSELDIWRPGELPAEAFPTVASAGLYETEPVEVEIRAIEPTESPVVLAARDGGGGLTELTFGPGKGASESPPLRAPALRVETLPPFSRMEAPESTSAAAQSTGTELLLFKPASTTGPEVGKHTVKRNETLYEISERIYGTPIHWRRIQKANKNIAPTALKIGMVLLIPKIEKAPPRLSPTTTLSKGPRRHAVAAGETFWAMAEKYYDDGTKWKVLWNANRDIVPDPNKLQAGITVVIPEMSSN